MSINTETLALAKNYINKKVELNSTETLTAAKEYTDSKINPELDPDGLAKLLEQFSLISHRNIYRGKYLGNTVSAAQKSAIQAGTFDDMFVGDYWTINSINYRIADIDYWYRCGDVDFNKHHLVIVPDSPMYNAKMNETDTTTGGYVGSQMYTANLESVKTTTAAAFGDLILSHREYLVNAVTDGCPSGSAWFDSTIELMNEIMVYGCKVYSPIGTGAITLTNYTIDKQQLAIFALNPAMVNRRAAYWLRDVVSSVYFADVSYGSLASCSGASSSSGVRPVFAIG